MNWLHFLLWVAGLYLLYYLVNILIDVAAAGKVAAANPLNNELTFSEPVHATQLQHQPVTPVAAPAATKKPSPEVIASGGVPISDVFNLARQESIMYTRSVSF